MWRIVSLALCCLSVLMVEAQSYLIDGKYLPEPVMQTGTDKPLYGYAIYEEAEGGNAKKFRLWIGYQYDEAYSFSEPTGLARVKVGDLYGFISTTNVMLIKPRFEQADNFDEKGFCRVVMDGKYGLIDSNGNFSIPNKYDTMDSLFNGWYEVSRDGEWGYIHRTNIYVSSYEEYQKKCESGLCD